MPKGAPLPQGVDPTSEIIRDFEYDYIFFDFLFLCVWLTVLFRNRHRFAFLYSLVVGIAIYCIDAGGWYHQQAKGFPAGTTLREWEFTLLDGKVLTRADAPQPWNSFDLSNTYVLMKHGADFMMLISYALIFFSWHIVVVQCWRLRAPISRALKYTALFFCGIMSIPFLSQQVPLFDARAWCVRHMAGEEEYGQASIFWKTWAGFAAMLPLYFRDPLVLPYLFAVGAFQAFTMVFGLYCFGIRPWDSKTFQYETLYLINQITPWIFISLDTLLPMCGINTDPEVLDRKTSLFGVSFVTLSLLTTNLMFSKLGPDVEMLFTGDATAAAVSALKHVLILVGFLCVLSMVSRAAKRFGLIADGESENADARKRD